MVDDREKAHTLTLVKVSNKFREAILYGFRDMLGYTPHYNLLYVYIIYSQCLAYYVQICLKK